jgi:hypothetical protein
MFDKVGCTVVSLTLMWYAQWFQWHCCDMHSGAIDTAVTCTAESITPLCSQLWSFSLQIRSHIQKGFNPCNTRLGGVVWWTEVKNLMSGSVTVYEIFDHRPFWILLRIRQDMIDFLSVFDTACTMNAVSLTPHAFLIFSHSIAVLHMIFNFRSCSKILLCMRCQWHSMHLKKF